MHIGTHTHHKELGSNCNIVTQYVQALITALLWKEGGFTHILVVIIQVIGKAWPRRGRTATEKLGNLYFREF